MIPNGTAYESYPSFANTGSKTPPGGSTESAKYSLGMVPADTFPAEWANWLFHGATAGISRLNADVNSIKKELNSILAAYNITNDASAYDQLLSALGRIYPQICTCDTAGATAAKSVAIQGDVLKPGLIYAVTFVHGNEYGDGTTTYPTFSINGGTAYPIKDNFGNYLKSGSWQDGETLEMLFTGSSFLTKYGISRATVDEIKAEIQELEELGTIYKTDVHDFGNNPTTWSSGFEYTFEGTVPVGKYRVHAIIPNDSNGSATWCIMVHSGDVSTTYEGITNWTTGWDVLIGNYTSGNLEGSGVIASQNHKGTIIDCGVMKVKSPLTRLKVAASTVSNITAPNNVQIVLEKLG